MTHVPHTPSRRTTVLVSIIAIVGFAGFAARPLANKGSGHDDDHTDEIRRALDGGRARQVILFIGDGMGDSEITLARNYQVGAAGRLALDTLPLTGAYTTYALQEANPRLPDYVPDSAATGTAWSTGMKTSNGRISTIAGSTGRAPIATLLELAQDAGYKVGNVSTAELTDATPAVLMSHVNDRGCQGPANMGPCAPYAKANGGPGSIAEQSVDHQVDVILGGGRARFAQTIPAGPHAGRTVIQSAQAQGYNVVFDKSGLAAASPGRPVLGLFNDGNMTLEWSGEPAAPFPGTGPQSCAEGQRESTSEPSLAEMTAKAIELLSANDGPARGRGRGRGNDRRTEGFFLQVEGASIDKQDHAEAPCQQIGETIAFDRAVRVGLRYAQSHPDTLIIVSADHGHTSQIVPVVSLNESVPRPGSLSTLITKEGAKMSVSYGTRAHGQSQDHTGTEVRVAAQGPQAANVLGVIDQTDIFRIIGRALGLNID